MPRFLCTVYTYSTRLRFTITYTHSFGTDTHTWRFRPLISSDSFYLKKCPFMYLKMSLNKNVDPKIKNLDFLYTKLTKWKKPPKNKICPKNKYLRFPQTKKICPKAIFSWLSRIYFWQKKFWATRECHPLADCL